jgi:hypothetical protein
MDVTRMLVCPKCSKVGQFHFFGGWTDLVCPSCKQQFGCLFAIVRGKRSRGNKKAGTREYSVRILVNGNEQLIEYSANDYYDFEMRSRDEVAILYRKNRVYLVHNFTINKYQRVGRDFNPAILIWAVLAMLVIVLLSLAHGR